MISFRYRSARGGFFIIPGIVFFLLLAGFLSPTDAFSSNAVRFLYDGDGNRMAKVSGDQITLYTDNFEKNLTTGKITKYYTSGKKRVAVKAENTLSFLVADHHGSTTGTTNLNGTVTLNIKYYPYGNYRSEFLNALSRTYINQIKDLETNLFYLNTRYYNPQTAVFLNPDQLSDSKNRNRYAYGAANPIAYSDPTGQCVGPLVFLLPACFYVSQALAAAAPILIEMGTVAAGAGIGAWAGGKISNEIVSRTYEPGSNEYEQGIGVGNYFQEKGGELATGGLIVTGVGSMFLDPRKLIEPLKADQINTLGKPVHEIAGPTKEGIYAVNTKGLKTPYSVSNIASPGQRQRELNISSVGPIDVVADYHHLPFADNSIGCLGGGCLLRTHYSGIAKEAERVVAPGGYAVFQGAFPELPLAFRNTSFRLLRFGYSPHPLNSQRPPDSFIFQKPGNPF